MSCVAPAGLDFNFGISVFSGSESAPPLGVFCVVFLFCWLLMTCEPIGQVLWQLSGSPS